MLGKCKAYINNFNNISLFHEAQYLSNIISLKFLKSLEVVKEWYKNAYIRE